MLPMLPSRFKNGTLGGATQPFFLTATKFHSRALSHLAGGQLSLAGDWNDASIPGAMKGIGETGVSGRRRVLLPSGYGVANGRIARQLLCIKNGKSSEALLSGAIDTRWQ